jgi:hypothetical protein
MIAGFGIDKLDIDAHAIAAALRGTLERIAHSVHARTRLPGRLGNGQRVPGVEQPEQREGEIRAQSQMPIALHRLFEQFFARFLPGY